MIKELEIMKALRYLLMVMIVALVSVTVEAQFAPVDTEYQWQSTSVMIGSGSALPQAAIDGASTTTDGDDASSSPKGGIRRIGGNTSGGSDDREDPLYTPLGDGVWALLLMAAGYLIYRVRTRKREVTA